MINHKNPFKKGSGINHPFKHDGEVENTNEGTKISLIDRLPPPMEISPDMSETQRAEAELHNAALQKLIENRNRTVISFHIDVNKHII